jgi:hypothetical protein
MRSSRSDMVIAHFVQNPILVLLAKKYLTYIMTLSTRLFGWFGHWGLAFPSSLDKDWLNERICLSVAALVLTDREALEGESTLGLSLGLLWFSLVKASRYLLEINPLCVTSPLISMPLDGKLSDSSAILCFEGFSLEVIWT